MRTFDPALADHLFNGATTLCTCWIVRRTDGAVSGYTDHDNSILLGEITCLASSGFHPTEAVTELGLAADGQEIEGALSTDALKAEDLHSGRYDGATVEVWLVNWAEPQQRHHMRSAILGEISREDGVFRAELRGLTSLLDQKTGRTYGRTCDAVVGDARCRVDLNAPAHRGFGVVTEVAESLVFKCSGLSPFVTGWFTKGNLQWTGGQNAGQSVEVTDHAGGDTALLSLWQSMPEPIAVGDTFSITVGCDKTFATCREKFSNQINFQGFPHMPGSDFALGYADAATIHDGGPLVE